MARSMTTVIVTVLPTMIITLLAGIAVQAIRNEIWPLINAIAGILIYLVVTILFCRWIWAHEFVERDGTPIH